LTAQARALRGLLQQVDGHLNPSPARSRLANDGVQGRQHTGEAPDVLLVGAGHDVEIAGDRGGSVENRGEPADDHILDVT
jgi:hypothetical protein